MADYSVHTITKTIFEVSLPNPTNTVQMALAMQAAEAGWKKWYDGDPVTDDMFTVTADEDAIRIQWDGPEAQVGGIQ